LNQIRARHHQQYAGHGFGGGAINRLDVGVWIRRTQKHNVSLAGQAEVVSELAFAHQEQIVFHSAHFFAAAKTGGTAVC
jgi:hypothetical protein